MSQTTHSAMGILLENLGIQTRSHVIAGVLIVLAFEISILGLAAAQAFVEQRLALSPWILLSIVWIVWSGWHSWLFPRNRLRYLKKYSHPYRQAFVVDVHPWVSLGFSQMWRPLINGENLNAIMSRRPLVSSSAPSLAVGLSLCVTALLVIIYAIRTIGIHNAAFLREFVEPETFAPIRAGIYNRVMHPLFWSGILYSVGLGIAVGRRSALIVAGLNCLYGLAYNQLENRRLGRIFGAAYHSYISEIPNFIPKLRRY